MAKNNTIVTDVLNHVGDDIKSKWYVGIATDAQQRLFDDHNVSKDEGKWIYRKATSEQEARDTEKYLLDNYDFKGGTGGGDKPVYVYAYKITANTAE